MQRGQEPSERRGSLVEIEIGRGEERHDAPPPRIAGAWPARAHPRRHGQRQPRRQLRQPALLVLDELRRGLASRQPDKQLRRPAGS
jgi:hypothetical protein